MAPKTATILDAFIRVVEHSPDRLAIHFEGEDYSYGDLENRSGRWAGGFAAAGIAPGDRVALCLENGIDFVGAYLGAQRAAGTIVVVNSQYRQVELRHILADCAARFCVVDKAKLPELNRSVGELPTLETIVVVDSRASDTDRPIPPVRAVRNAPNVVAASDFVRNWRSLPPLPSPEDVALIAYTSGTTGQSKGAMLSHRNLFENSRSVTSAWRWTHRDQLLLTLPLFHIHGLGVGLNGALLTGSSIILRRRFDPIDVLDTLGLGKITMFFGVPTMYTRLIAEAKKRDLPPPPIRLYVSGSAPLSAGTFGEFVEIFGQTILERYGMTETVMNLSNPFDGERRPGTVGQPFPGQEARIVDLQSREPIVDERPGEIQVRGPHVFSGYLRQPEATEAAFDPDGWFNTGDLGWCSADGYYTISGRARELIITGGYNVYPREVEEVLASHPAVEEAAVLGLPDADLGERVVAVVVFKANATVPTADDLVSLCRDRLASYKKPRQVFVVDRLPRNALGKIQKHLINVLIEEQIG